MQSERRWGRSRAFAVYALQCVCGWEYAAPRRVARQRSRTGEDCSRSASWRERAPSAAHAHRRMSSKLLGNMGSPGQSWPTLFAPTQQLAGSRSTRHDTAQHSGPRSTARRGQRQRPRVARATAHRPLGHPPQGTPGLGAPPRPHRRGKRRRLHPVDTMDTGARKAWRGVATRSQAQRWHGDPRGEPAPRDARRTWARLPVLVNEVLSPPDRASAVASTISLRIRRSSCTRASGVTRRRTVGWRRPRTLMRASISNRRCSSSAAKRFLRMRSCASAEHGAGFTTVSTHARTPQATHPQLLLLADASPLRLLRVLELLLDDEQLAFILVDVDHAALLVDLGATGRRVSAAAVAAEGRVAPSRSWRRRTDQAHLVQVALSVGVLEVVPQAAVGQRVVLGQPVLGEGQIEALLALSQELLLGPRAAATHIARTMSAWTAKRRRADDAHRLAMAAECGAANGLYCGADTAY